MNRSAAQAFLVGLGTAVVPLDTAVNIAFPAITRGFDLATADIQWVVICYVLTYQGNDWYVFLQKMRELRITNGTSLGPNFDGRNGSYSIGVNGVPPLGDPGNLLRKQVAVFMVRGFFL